MAYGAELDMVFRREPESPAEEEWLMEVVCEPENLKKARTGLLTLAVHE